MNSGFKSFQRQSWLIGSLALLMGLSWSKAVHAEGSVDLIRDPGGGGFRPFLEYRNDFTPNDPATGTRRQSLIRVYAQAGETLNLGSSATGIGAGTINFTRPDGSTGTCGVGVGLIADRNAEVNRTYVPCTVTVGAGQTGIWEIQFVSPDPNSISDPTDTLVVDPWTQPNNVGYVAAWDVTVTNNGQAIPGRAYANYLALNMGANGISLNSRAFILTDIGYQYQVDLNGIDPFGFIFFANSKGFTDQPCPGGNPLYTSVSLVPTPNVTFSPPNVCIPSRVDIPASNDITYKIFFNPPDTTLPTDASIAPSNGGTTWLVRPPVPIPTITDDSFKFVGKEGTPGRAGSKPAPPPPELGGNFVFTATGPGNYVITIDANRDGILGNGNDRILRGRTTGGPVNVNWNGLDGQGQPLRAGATAYDSKLTFFVGDIHFPFLDPENNPNGLIIRNLNTGNSIVYYNDSDLNLNIGTPTNPISALGGIDSSSGVHNFSGNFGNNNGVDTWTSLVNPIVLSGGILIQKADPTITKTVSTNTPVAAGGPITYTLNVTSNPPPAGDVYTNIKGVPVTDTIPPEINGVTWTCAPTSGVGACSTASGSGNNINLTVDLNVGATVTITVQGTVSPVASGDLVNTATVDRPPDVVDANVDNNTSSARVTVLPNPIQPAGLKSVRLFTDTDNSDTLTTGDIVEYTIIYSNTQPDADILGFQAIDALDASKLSFVSGSYSFTASGAGTTVTPNPNYNGTTDTNIVIPGGTLGRAGGQVVIKFRAVVNAPAGTVIINQVIAQSSNGTINPTISDAFAGPGDILQTSDDGVNQGNFPNTGDDDPTVIVVTAPGVGPNLRVVKRITNVTRNGAPVNGINFNSFVDDPTNDNDNALGWSAVLGSPPVGAFNIGDSIALSGDDIEYTIYFLSDGSQAVQNAQLCDAIPTGSTFINNSFGSGSGLLLNQAGASNPQTNAADADKASFTSPLTPVAPPCADTNNPNGSILFQLGNIPPNTGGFMRFRVRIN